MTTRIEDMPVFAARDHQIEAGLYNLWRRAKLHLNFPLRLEIPDFEYMVLIIEKDSWVVVDENKFDLPILAWVDFQDQGRDSLHTPVECTLNYYHYMASKLREPSLHFLAEALQQRLR